MANILSIGQGFPNAMVRYQFSPATGKTFVAGDIVKLVDESTVDYATLSDNENSPVFIVMEGNDTFSGHESKKLVCVAGHFSFSTSNYQTGSYTVNTPLTADTGKFAVAGSLKKVIGHVMAFSVAQGIKVKFNA